MNKILGKIKKKGRNTIYKKILSEETIYILPNFESSISYVPTYKLESNEWFYIENFSKTKYSIELLKKEISTAEYDTITKEDLLNISYICSIQDEKYYCFQNIKKSQRIQKKWIGQQCEIKSESLILIENFPEAIYNKEIDILYFKSLSKLDNIFKGINELYREATEEEVEEFLSKDYIKIQEGFNKKSIGILERKKLAMTMDEYNKCTNNEKEKILQELKENFPEKMDKSGKFKINEIEDFKIILSVLREDAYKTITGKRKIANSSRII